jgi:thymidylate kinase
MVKKYIQALEALSCKLVREGDDFDFLLLDNSQKESVVKYLLDNGFILTHQEKNKMNFKKYENTFLIDIDIDSDIVTEYLQTYFYDVEIVPELVQNYFFNSQKYAKCVNILRYTLLLRGYGKKYRDFFLENKHYIIENNYCLKYLIVSPFKKEFQNFEDFLAVIDRRYSALLKYVKLKYIIKFFQVKFFKKRAKVVTFLGIDGSGKTTVIEHLERDFGYHVFYLGDRSIRFSKLYTISFLKPLSIFIQYFEKLLRVLKIYILTFRGKNILTDRYYYFDGESFSLKGKIYTLLYNKLFIKPDIVIVLWADSQTILQRKQEVSQEEIELFNRSIERLPFKNVYTIKNENLDETLNKIIEILQ